MVYAPVVEMLVPSEPPPLPQVAFSERYVRPVCEPLYDTVPETV